MSRTARARAPRLAPLAAAGLVLGVLTLGGLPATASADPVTVPAAPTDVVATAGDGTATISWDPSGDDSDPLVTVTASPGGGICSTHGLSCTISGLSDGTSYSFVVDASNAAGSGPSSPAGPVTPEPAVPSAPGSVSEAPTNIPGELSISWTAADPGEFPIDSYTAYDGSGDTCSAPTSGNGSCVVDGLTPGTSYAFRVFAHNAAGNGPGQASSNTASPIGVGTPQNLRAVAGNGTVTLSWQAPSVPALGYHVTWSPGNGSATTTGTGYAIGNLSNGTGYQISVTATYGPFSGSPATASSTPFTAPGLPTGLVATARDGAVDLAWAAPASDGGARLTGYIVTETSTGFTGCTVSATSCTVAGLTNATTYDFQVRAVNSGNAKGPNASFNPVTPMSDLPASTSTSPSTLTSAPTSVAAPLVRHTQLLLSKPSVKHGVTSWSVTLRSEGNAPLASRHLSVIATDSLRHRTTHVVTTNGRGTASLSIKAAVTTSVQVVFVGSPGYTATSKSTKLVVAAPQTCSLKRTELDGLLSAAGTCTEPHLPKHTGLRLQYLRGKTWVTAAKGSSSGDVLRFRFSLRASGTFRFRILLNANAVYGATTLTLPTVRVP